VKILLEDLFQYSHHCNNVLISYFSESREGVPEKSIMLFSHLVNAHHLWNCRIGQRKTTYGVFEIHDIKQLQKIENENFEITSSILKNENPERTIDYVNTKGVAYKNSIQEILFHVINHSTYHRAQIASNFREKGLQPILTDYIAYKRKEF
jgi:uncharacterized damage-inducible protein DinB